MLHSCASGRHCAVVVLLVPEGFTSSKLPARPDICFIFLLFVWVIITHTIDNSTLSSEGLLCCLFQSLTGRGTGFSTVKVNQFKQVNTCYSSVEDATYRAMLLHILIRVPYMYCFFNMFHMCDDGRQFVVVALLDPEGFTSSKLPARPDVSFNFFCYLYGWLLLIPSTAVHCRLKGSFLGYFRLWQGELLDFPLSRGNNSSQ